MFGVPSSRRWCLAAGTVIALVLAGGLSASCGTSIAGETRVTSAALAQGSSASAPDSQTPDASGEQTAGAVVGSTPHQRGPGAVLTFDPKTAPVVPKGTTVGMYVVTYYRALMDKKWSKAFKMVPKADPKETLTDFEALQQGYEVGSFSIAGPTSGVAISVLVVHVTPGNGVWNTTWEFVRTRRGTVVKDLTYARPGGGGCH